MGKRTMITYSAFVLNEDGTWNQPSFRVPEGTPETLICQSLLRDRHTFAVYGLQEDPDAPEHNISALKLLPLTAHEPVPPQQFEGLCPECGMGVKYPSGYEDSDHSRFYGCNCPACGWEGTECHKIEFENFETETHGRKWKGKRCKKKS